MVYSTLLFHVDIAVNTYLGKTSYCKFLQQEKQILFSVRGDFHSAVF